MAAARSKRNTNEINYALFNNTGKKTEHEMEEGQLAESPFNVHVDDGEFHSTSNRSEGENDHDHDESILDDTLTHRSDNENEVPKLAEEESILSVNDHDLVQDEVWKRQQEILQVNKEHRDRLRLQLMRKKELNEALLREEEEHKALALMKREVSRLENKRSVQTGTGKKQNNVNFAKNANMADMGVGGNATHMHHHHMRQHVGGLEHEQEEWYYYGNRGTKPAGVQQNPMTGVEKINKWLANSEEIDAFHDTLRTRQCKTTR